ncbi:DNA repair protein RecO [Bacteroidia bacterium]|nr:DNA repair protein RecO [Bacteroidia bacterium]
MREFDSISAMKLESVGIIVGLRPFEDRDALARIFTRDFGILSGILKGAQVAKRKPLIGQIGAVSWNARLESQLGAFHFESDKNLLAPLFAWSDALALANSALALCAAFLPEREKYPALFLQTIKMFELLNQIPDKTASGVSGMTHYYLSWEIDMLREMGYAMDLTRCGGCGRCADLTHISRRTGRAVCSVCAAPYAEHCFEMPVTLLVTRHFLERAAADLGMRSLPVERELVMSEE